jgi:hypothetical protein
MVESGRRGLLMVWTDYPGDQAEFEEWYNHRHVPDRVPGVPGFHLCIRYLNIGSGPKYLAYYETRGTSVLQSPAYLELVRNRDPQTQRILPQFRNVVRTVGTISAERRLGYGAYLALVAIRPQAGREAALRRAIAEEFLPALAGSAGIVRAALIERDTSTLTSSSQLHVRKDDRSFEWVLLLDGTSRSSVEDLARSRIEDMAAAGGQPDTPALFQAISFVPGEFR